jgi:TatA/E family protein of Tat protein translocase
MIVLVLFGAGRIPEILRSMGRGVREFKHAVRDDSGDEKVVPDTADRPEAGKRTTA